MILNNECHPQTIRTPRDYEFYNEMPVLISVNIWIKKRVGHSTENCNLVSAEVNEQKQ